MYQKIWTPLILTLLIVGCDGDDRPPEENGGQAPAGVMGGEGPVGGEPVGGEPVGGEPVGGEPVGGAPVGGEPVGGAPVGGEPVGGEPVGGAPVGGAPVGGEPVGGAPVGGAPVGGAPVGGEPVGGEPVGGEPVGGEPVGGEPVGGAPVGGEEPDTLEPGPGLEYTGSVEANNSAEHPFFVANESYVWIYTSDGNGGCPEGVDTTLTLYEVDASGQKTELYFNDDYNFSYCSRLEVLLPAGNYIAEVQGFLGEAVDSYVLSIMIINYVAAGEACEVAMSPEQFVDPCISGYDCLEGTCVNVTPEITSATAYTYQDLLFINVQGTDLDQDAIYLDIFLYDDDLNLLDIIYEYVDQGEGPDFTGFYAGGAYDLDLATQVGLSVTDLANPSHSSEELLVPLGELPVISAGEPCEINRTTGRCEGGYVCTSTVDSTAGLCLEGVPPTSSDAVAYSDGDQLILAINGADVNEDISQMQVTLYDGEGLVISIGGQPNARLEFVSQSEGATPDVTRFVSILEGLSQYPLATAVELSLVDSEELLSPPLIATITTLPVSAIGEPCDLNRLESSCGPYFCVIDLDNGGGICVESLPSYGEGCVPEIGCAEGLLCYDAGRGLEVEALYGTCLRACDENAVEQGFEVGCLEDEACVPDFPLRDFGVTTFPSPGFCLPTEGCDPLNTASACGEGDFFCSRYLNTTRCVDLANVAPEMQMAEGEECNGSDVLCQAGLVCEFGTCRAACSDDATCAEGSSCISAEGGSYSFCMPVCDLFAQDCPNNEVCELLSVNDGQIVAQCVEGSAQGTVETGGLCDPNAGDIPGYWGDCANPAICGNVGDAEATCLEICTQEQNSCTGDHACVDRLLNIDELGLCFGQCDPVLGVGCEEGSSCLIMGQGLNANSETKIVGVCEENPNVGTVPTTGACVEDVNLTNNCAPGHLCRALSEETPSQCIQLCSVDDEGNTIVSCTQPGQECIYLVPEEAGSDVLVPLFAELPNLGVCL